MAKWQRPLSKDEIAERDAQPTVHDLLPQFIAAVEAWLASGQVGEKWEKEFYSLLHPLIAGDARVTPLVEAALDKAGMALVRPAIAKLQQQKRVAQAALYQSRLADAILYSDYPTEIGQFAIVTSHYGRESVVVCISCSGYEQPDAEDNFDGGYYAEFAEPTPEEQLLPAYRKLAEPLARKQQEATIKAAQQEIAHEAALAAIRTSGREPTWDEELFAGMDSSL